MPPNAPAPLRAGDSLRVGSSVLTVTGDASSTVIDTRGVGPGATREPTGTFPLAGNLGATVRGPAPVFPVTQVPGPVPVPPAAQAPARRSLPWLGVGCGLVILLLVCAGIGLGATAGRSPIATALAQLNPGAATAAATAIIDSTPTPALEGTAAPTSGAGEPTPGGDTEVPVTTVPVGPAPTLLAPKVALDSAAGLAAAVGALNQAELNFLTQDAAKAPAETLDAGLLDVAARAMAVAQLTDPLSEALGAQDGGSDQALETGQTYAALSRLAYSLVIEAQNLRDGLRLGTLAPGEAAGIIGEYGARLWQPGFEGPAAAPAANESGPLVEPFQPNAASAGLAPVRRLRPEALAAMTASFAEGTVLKSWLATSSETVTRTVWVPALAPGQLAPPDYLDAALTTQLITPAGQAKGEVARQAAAAHLRVLLGMGTVLTATAGPVQGAPLALFDRGAGAPQPLVVTLLSRAVTGQPEAPAGSAAGPGLASGLARQTAPTGLSTVPGGHVQALAQGGVKVITYSSSVTQQNQPSTFEETATEDSPGVVLLTVDGVFTNSGESANALRKEGRGGVGIKLHWQAVSLLNPRRLSLTTICTANPGGIGGVGRFGDTGPSGNSVVALVLKLDETYSVQCFGLTGEMAVSGGFKNGLVLGRTQPFTVILPSFDDRDHDGVPDNEDKCPDTPEDIDNVADKDGCPETDADQDGTLDSEDVCPELAGPPDDHGCPPADDDGDGVPNFKDQCPQLPEDKDGVQDDDGCPEYDADSDNIRDEEDKCPTDKEDYDNFQDADGCPDLDNDEDKLFDNLDDCPDEAENYNGFLDDDGCFDRWPSYTFAGSIAEAAADHTGDHFTINTTFNLVVDLNSGAVNGTFNGSGTAQVPFTCYNSEDPSEIYDHAKVTYTITYAATVSGSAEKNINNLVLLDYAPAGTVTGVLSEPYTHEKCTHLNSGTIPGLGGFSGKGLLTLVVSELGHGSLKVDWKTDGFDSVGGWQGNGTAP
jgi:hypothetical protein